MKVLEDPNVAQSQPELSALFGALDALRKGDAEVRLPPHWDGLAGKVAEAFSAPRSRTPLASGAPRSSRSMRSSTISSTRPARWRA